MLSKRVYIFFISLGVFLGVGKGWAETVPLDLNHVPLVVSESVPPNVLVSLDDSGSMNWGYIPDSVEGHEDLNAYKAASYNRLAYNPEVTYSPGVNYLGEELPEADFNAAQLFWLLQGGDTEVDVYVAQVKATNAVEAVNLATNYRPPYQPYSAEKWAEEADDGDDENPGQPAYYYVRNNSCAEELIDDSCYNKVVVSEDEQQNFANWYQFYSLRITAGKSVTSRAFKNLPASVRVAQQTFGSRIRTSSYVKPFSESSEGGKEAFYDWLFGVQGSGSTHLREAVADAGEFFSYDGDNNAYWRLPGGEQESDSEQLTCRRNFQVMLTDGYYTELREGVVELVGDADNTAVTSMPDGQSYNPNVDESTIYASSEGRNGGVAENTLADFAFNYWINDLRPDLDNNVPPAIIVGDGEPENLTLEEYWDPVNNPATWQHMVNYFIGFGVTGNFDSDSEADYEGLLAGDLKWVVPTPLLDDDTDEDKAARIDDLWHAAINSRGDAFSASDPEALETALSDIINILSFTESSIAAVDVSGPSLLGDTEVFQASFETQYWTGSVEGSQVSDGSGVPGGRECNDQEAGTICAVSKSASLGNLGNKVQNTVLWREREAYGFNGRGIDLTGGSVNWDALSEEQQILLIDGGGEVDGKSRLDYLLGDHAFEVRRGDSLGKHRRRRFEQKVLGAVVSSSPVYVGNGLNSDGSYRRLYPDWVSPESQSYIDFIGTVGGPSSVADRAAYVYVASNDGFLHAYDGESLEEQFLYLPSAMFPTITEFTEPGFVYRPYVDGELTEADVFFGSKWQTLLVGGFRGGAKGLFALDITSPENFDEDNVLWEYSEVASPDAAEDDDLGHLYGRVSLNKSNLNAADGDLSSGSWVAAFGNGYNSVNGRAVLYLLDPESGEEIAKLDTTIGPNSSSENSVGANVNSSIPNGLGAPFLVDLNQDFRVDLAYAGDLYGNMWRFDLRDSSKSQWSVTLVYAAKSAEGVPQPITGRPVVNRHPSGLPGVMVYFGSGKYLEPDDIEPVAERQTFYGIWDRIDDDLDVDRDGDGQPANDAKHIGNGFKRDHLLEQEIEQEANAFSGVTVRTVSNEGIVYFNGDELPGNGDGDLGWFMDFDPGELIPGNPILRGGNVIFSTLIPSGDLCTPGGSSWIMELDAKSGGPSVFQAFDNNNDYVVTKEDEFNGVVTAGWQGDDTGVYSDPSIIFNPKTGLDLKVVSTSSGAMVNVIEQEPQSGVGRQQWRKLR